MSNRYLSRAIALALLGVSAQSLAITSVENNAGIPFNFANPGARSLAMGGAFLGAADDATAALSNPAGLTRLGTEQQFSVEFRNNMYESPYPRSGAADVNPLDLSGVNYDDAENDISELSYISWVLPRDNWALAVYRSQMVDYENNYRTQPIFFDLAQGFFLNPYDARTDLSVATYGVSFAYQFNDALSVGGGISYNDFEIDTSVNRYTPLTLTGDIRDDVYTEASRISTQRQFGDDNDIAFNLGLLFRGSDNFSIGVAYRSAPEFDYRYQNVAGPQLLAGALGVEGVFTGQLTADGDTHLKAPDMLGVGFNWRPTDRLSINLDVNRIAYSNVSDEVLTPYANQPDDPITLVTQLPIVINGVRIPAGTEVPGFAATAEDLALARAIQSDDVIEPHIGVEYVIDSLKHPLSLRAGFWREDLHTLQFVGDPERFNRNASPAANEARGSAILFSSGDSYYNHYTAGLGWAFESFQIDLAYDASETISTFSVSGVLRF